MRCKADLTQGTILTLIDALAPGASRQPAGKNNFPCSHCHQQFQGNEEEWENDGLWSQTDVGLSLSDSAQVT